MVIINSDKDMDMGSKRFTLLLADAIRPFLKNFLNEDELDDFELDLYQVMIHIGYWTQENFMKLFRVIEKITMNDFEEDRLLLLELMQKDVRFQKQ